MEKHRPVIEVHGLRKEYPVARSLGDLIRHPLRGDRVVRALDDVSFTVHAGRISAVIGLNGAGKTTLLRILCDLLAPSAGDVFVAGHSLDRNGREVRRLIGFVPSDERSFFWRISGRANLEFFASLFDVPPHVAARRIDVLLDRYGLTGSADECFRDYSSGMRKRLAIVRGLLHEPRVLVMDEPTNSLDACWDRRLRDEVRRWVRQDERRAVLWATHRMEEVRDVCDGVIHLAGGRLAACEEVGARRPDAPAAWRGEPLAGATR